MAGVARLLAQRAKERPEATAYLSGPDGRRLTWADLARQAAATQALGLPPNARVGIVAADPLAFAATYLGVLAAGLTAVPLDPRLTPHELSAAKVRLRVDVTLPDASVRGVARGFVDHPTVLLTSSGTTGQPKGIALSEAQLLHAALRVARHHRLGPAERGYSPLPLFHVGVQVMGLLATLISGASLVLDPRFEPDAYWEAAGQITANPLDPVARREGSVGLPVGVGLAVLGPDGMQMPVGETGMVALHGPAVTAHYLVAGPGGTEQRGPASDAFGWLPTGDLGYRDEYGFLYLVGRPDDAINRGSHRPGGRSTDPPAIRVSVIPRAPRSVVRNS